MTDYKMTKPTSHYKQEFIRNIRDNFLDKIYKKKSSEIINIEYKQIPQEKIKKFNKLCFLSQKTIRQQYSIVLGSNPSGAEKNIKNTPFFVNNDVFDDLEETNYEQYQNLNFLNPLNRYKSKNQLDPKNVKEILNKKKYDLIEIKDLLLGKEYYLNNIKNDIFEFNNSNKVQKFRSNTESEEEIIEEYINSKKGNKFKLRSLHSKNVKKIFDEEPNHYDVNKENAQEIHIEKAHIIRFSKLIHKKEKHNIKKAIDGNNVMFIPSHKHKSFDKNQLTFDNLGNIIYKNNKEKVNKYLLIENFTKKQFEYLKENYKY